MPLFYIRINLQKKFFILLCPAQGEWKSKGTIFLSCSQLLLLFKYKISLNSLVTYQLIYASASSTPWSLLPHLSQATYTWWMNNLKLHKNPMKWNFTCPHFIEGKLRHWEDRKFAEVAQVIESELNLCSGIKFCDFTHFAIASPALTKCVCMTSSLVCWCWLSINSQAQSLLNFQYVIRWHSGKESTCPCRRNRRHGFDPWVGRYLGEENGNPLQYSCLENSIRSLAGYSSWGHKESDTNEHACMQAWPPIRFYTREDDSTGNQALLVHLGAIC